LKGKDFNYRKRKTDGSRKWAGHPVMEDAPGIGVGRAGRNREQHSVKRKKNRGNILQKVKWGRRKIIGGPPIRKS